MFRQAMIKLKEEHDKEHIARFGRAPENPVMQRKAVGGLINGAIKSHAHPKKFKSFMK